MTMYPGGAAPMYMVTWPDVGTLNTGVALTDNVSIARNQSLRLSAKVAWQQQRLNNEEGYHALKVFFPGMTDAYHQTTGRIAASYQCTMHNSCWRREPLRQAVRHLRRLEPHPPEGTQYLHEFDV